MQVSLLVEMLNIFLRYDNFYVDLWQTKKAMGKIILSGQSGSGKDYARKDLH